MQMCAPRPISFHKTPLNFVINAFRRGRGPHWFACLVVGHWSSSFLMPFLIPRRKTRKEEHTSELQSLMRISYAVSCLKKKKYYIPLQYPEDNNDICMTRKVRINI